MFILTEFYLIDLKRKTKNSCHKSLTNYVSFLTLPGKHHIGHLWPWYHYRTVEVSEAPVPPPKASEHTVWHQNAYKLWRWTFFRRTPWYFLTRFTSLHSQWCDVTVSTSMCLRRINTREAAPLSWLPLEAPLSVHWLGRWKVFSGRLWW